MDEKTKQEILAALELEGAASNEEKTVQLIIASKEHNDKIIDKSSGLPRLRNSIAKQFQLILGQPSALRLINPLQIRCCLCGRVISYPAWYRSERLLVNWFNYFICFDVNSSNKPSTSCMRRI